MKLRVVLITIFLTTFALAQQPLEAATASAGASVTIVDWVSVQTPTEDSSEDQDAVIKSLKDGEPVSVSIESKKKSLQLISHSSNGESSEKSSQDSNRTVLVAHVN